MKNEKTQLNLACALALGACLSACAAPKFFIPETLYAAPGIECNVYFKNVFDSCVPQNYAYEARSRKGRCEGARWCWTPSAEDAGARVPVVFNAFDDGGLVASATTTVQVAKAAVDPAAKRTLALLAASLTNSRYQDQLASNMWANGFANYTPVGCRGGESCAAWGTFNGVAHDGYGGFTFGDFLRRWQIAEDELMNVQKEAEREQLKAFGVKVGKDWRRHLLKSPLVRIVDGKKTVDVQAWLDRVNGGKAPDYVVIELGVNGTFGCQTQAALEQHVRDVQLADAAKLVDALRAKAPNALIAICTEPVGCGQDAYAQNYGAAHTEVQNRRNTFYLNRELVKWLKARGDARMALVPFAQAIDPVYGYPRVAQPANARCDAKVVRDYNALHPSPAGGRQLGDALYAWLANVW